MLDAKPSHSDEPMPRSSAPDEDADRSEFDDLLRRASEVLRAGAKAEQGGLGTGNPKGRGRNQ